MQTLPTTIPITSEVQLEKIHNRHAPMLFAQIDRHRCYLSQFVNWTPFNTCLQDAFNFVQRCDQQSEQGLSFTWAICVNGDGVGTFSLNEPIDWQHRTAMLGYWLSPEMQGKGIVTQAVSALITQTSGLFDHYILKCAIHNVRSNAVAQRCGFTFIETLTAAEQIGETWFDQNVYRKSIK